MPLLPVASSPALSATSTSVTEVNAPLSLDAGKVASGTESVEGFGNPAAKASGEKERKGSSVVLNNTSSRHNAEKSEDITSLPEQVIQEMDTSPGSLQKVAAASIASSTMPHGTKLAETGKPQDATRLQEGKQGAERKHRKSRAASLQSQSHTPWISTEEWLHATIGSMPTFALKRMLDFLNSEMQTQKDKYGGVMHEGDLLDFISRNTLVGILPVPHPIVMHRYQPNGFTALWFTTFLWSTVFLSIGREISLIDANKIKLFNIIIT